jgi:methyl-accepting chemotaxis protein
MKNWTVKKRIIAGFAVIVLLSIIMGILAWNTLRIIGEHTDQLAGENIPGLSKESLILQNLANAHLVLIRHVMTAKAEEKLADEARLKEIGDTITTLLADLDKSCLTPEEKTFCANMTQARKDYLAARIPILQLSDAGKNEEALALLLTSGRTTYDVYDKLCTDFNALETKTATDSAATIAGNVRSSKITLGSGVLAELVLSTLLGALVVTGLNRTLRRVSSSLDEEAEQVTAAAGQVSQASQSLAEGASEQAASLEETSSSLEEMSSMTKRNADNAQKANDLAKQARSAADKGVGDMQAMSTAMEAIKTSSDDIAKIIKTIDEIAFQTNILALNAAVEAARAGEAGMGFAVVADEVRNLAQRSAQAAKETAAMIEGAISKTGQGVEISRRVAETLNEIVAKARQVDELVAEVAGASREQTQGITQINTAVGQMDKVTQSNAASAEESAAASEQLNAQAETMKQSVLELLQLVEGSRQSAAMESAAAPRDNPETRRPAPTAKRPAPARQNGHGRPAPALAASSQNGKDINLEGDFKDF